jgi:hypothetical protein
LSFLSVLFLSSPFPSVPYRSLPFLTFPFVSFPFLSFPFLSMHHVSPQCIFVSLCRACVSTVPFTVLSTDLVHWTCSLLYVLPYSLDYSKPYLQIAKILPLPQYCKYPKYWSPLSLPFPSLRLFQRPFHCTIHWIYWLNLFTAPCISLFTGLFTVTFAFVSSLEMQFRRPA